MKSWPASAFHQFFGRKNRLFPSFPCTCSYFTNNYDWNISLLAFLRLFNYNMKILYMEQFHPPNMNLFQFVQRQPFFWLVKAKLSGKWQNVWNVARITDIGSFFISLSFWFQFPHAYCNYLFSKFELHWFFTNCS